MTNERWHPAYFAPSFAGVVHCPWPAVRRFSSDLEALLLRRLQVVRDLCKAATVLSSLDLPGRGISFC
jgi:hypothetical protein